jgi:hypothetical protein
MAERNSRFQSARGLPHSRTLRGAGSVWEVRQFWSAPVLWRCWSDYGITRHLISPVRRPLQDIEGEAFGQGGSQSRRYTWPPQWRLNEPLGAFQNTERTLQCLAFFLAFAIWEQIRSGSVGRLFISSDRLCSANSASHKGHNEISSHPPCRCSRFSLLHDLCERLAFGFTEGCCR